ncbi:MAG TPA: response regulator [Bacteroidia bacterium]|jgi:CheY-like chemotaxis protein
MTNLNILFAEDDEDDGLILYDSFRQHPSFSNVTWVKNGKELLNALNNPHSEKPDVLLTDINMPLINGIEALEEIFKNKTLNKIPAFVYTSTNNPNYEKKCKELGVKAFLVKPFNLFEMTELPYQILYMLGINAENSGIE